MNNSKYCNTINTAVNHSGQQQTSTEYRYINDMFIHKKITNRFFLNTDVLDFKHFSGEGTRLVTCNLNDVLA